MSTAISRRYVTIPILGFGCLGSGALIVERALAGVSGVARVYVNAETEMAYVQYDAERCNLGEMRAAIERAGFHAGEPVAQ